MESLIYAASNNKNKRKGKGTGFTTNTMFDGFLDVHFRVALDNEETGVLRNQIVVCRIVHLRQEMVEINNR